MGNTKTEMYIEVYSILNLLGEAYIKALPKSLYQFIEENTEDIKKLKYKSLLEVNKNNTLKKSIAMIALFHLKYWCNTENEKKEIQLLLEKNYQKNEIEKRNKYNPEDIFKKDSINKKSIEIINEINKTKNQENQLNQLNQLNKLNSNLPIQIKKENKLKRIINLFLRFLKRK